MNVINLMDQNFDDLIKKGTFLVDFYADWCGPCKMLAPVIEEVSKEQEEVTFIKVNVDTHPALAQFYKVLSIPTLILFKEGTYIEEKQGFLSKQMLLSWLEENK